MSDQTLPPSLSAILQQPPSPGVWATLCEAVVNAELPEASAHDALLDALRAWPEELRALPLSALDRLADEAADALFAIARTLTLDSEQLDEERLEALTTATCLAPIRRLTITEHALTDTQLDALLGAPLVADLTHLTLESCALGNDSLKVIARQAPNLRALRHLSIGNTAAQRAGEGELSNVFRARGLRALAAASELSALESLDLSGVPLGVSGMRRFVQSTTAWTLRSLSLAHGALDDRALELLLHAPQFSSIEELDLTGNWITEGSVEELLRLEQDCALRRLDLSFTSMQDTPLTELLPQLDEAAHLDQLEEIRWGLSSTNPQRWFTS